MTASAKFELHPVQVLAEKLGHALAEVRRRAIENLRFKVQHNIWKASELIKGGCIKGLAARLCTETELDIETAAVELLLQLSETQEIRQSLLSCCSEELLQQKTQAGPLSLRSFYERLLGRLAHCTQPTQRCEVEDVQAPVPPTFTQANSPPVVVAWQAERHPPAFDSASPGTFQLSSRAGQALLRASVTGLPGADQQVRRSFAFDNEHAVKTAASETDVHEAHQSASHVAATPMLRWDRPGSARTAVSQSLDVVASNQLIATPTSRWANDAKESTATQGVVPNVTSWHTPERDSISSAANGAVQAEAQAGHGGPPSASVQHSAVLGSAHHTSTLTRHAAAGIRIPAPSATMLFGAPKNDQVQDHQVTTPGLHNGTSRAEVKAVECSSALGAEATSARQHRTPGALEQSVPSGLPARLRTQLKSRTAANLLKPPEHALSPTAHARPRTAHSADAAGHTQQHALTSSPLSRKARQQQPALSRDAPDPETPSNSFTHSRWHSTMLVGHRQAASRASPLHLAADDARTAQFANERSLQPLSAPQEAAVGCGTEQVTPSAALGALMLATQPREGQAGDLNTQQNSGAVDAREQAPGLRRVQDQCEWRALAQSSKEPQTRPLSRWQLPRIHVPAVDDQYLFELNVKLQYAEEERALVGALQDLRTCAAPDLPPEAFLQRAALLDTCLAIIANEAATPFSRHLVMSFLASLVDRIKASLVNSSDSELLPNFAEFHGPDDKFEFNAEEEHLLRCHPQPRDTASLPAWRQPEPRAEPPLDITACCHVIATRTMPILSHRHGSVAADAFSLLEALMPLLAVLPEDRGSAAAVARVTEYLESLSRVLESLILRDGEGLAGMRNAPQPGAGTLLDEAPALGPESLHVLSIVSRFLAYLSPQDAGSAAPKALSLRLGRLWCNPCMEPLIPGWRAAIEPYLPEMCPTCVEAAKLAEDASHALKHAEDLHSASVDVLHGKAPLAGWLERVPMALTAVAFGPHQDLLRLVMLVLSRAEASHTWSGNDDACRGRSADASAAADTLLLLLRHPVGMVKQQAWAWLLKLLQPEAADAQARTGLLHLMSSERLLQFLVVDCQGAHRQAHAESAAFVLRQVLTADDARLREGVMKWQPWLECHADCATLGAVYALVDANMKAVPPSTDGADVSDLDWAHLRVLLQRLFSKHTSVRRAAAQRLVTAMAGCTGLLAEAGIEEDPFRGLLDGQAISAASNHATSDLGALRVVDVHNLMGCVCNTTLQASLRSSAAHQLIGMVANPAFLSALAVPSFLRACFHEIELALGLPEDSSAPDEEGDTATSQAQPLSIYEMQLPVACLLLLGSMCCCSSGVLAWAVELTASGRLQAILPLALHPLSMVRRATAVFLCPLIFLPACQALQPDLPAPMVTSQNTTADKGIHLPLFRTFFRAHYFPLPTAELQEPEAHSSCDSAASSAHVGATADLLGNQGRGKLQMVSLLLSLGKLAQLASIRASADEQEAPAVLAADLRHERECGHLRNLLRHLPGDVDVPYEIARSLTTTFQLNDVVARARHGWEEALAAQDATARAQSIARIHQLALSTTDCRRVLVQSGDHSTALHALTTLLGAPPSHAEEHDAWQALLALLCHVLSARVLPASAVFELLAAMVPTTVAVIARWSTSSPNRDEDTDSQVLTVAQPGTGSRHARHLSETLISHTLNAFATLLSHARSLCSRGQLARVAELLCSVDMIGLLINNQLAHTSCAYSCSLPAAEVAREIAQLCADARDDLWGASATAEPSHHKACTGTLTDLTHGLCSLLQCLVRTVGMHHQQRDTGEGYQRRHLLRVALQTLRAICSALPAAIWSEAWSEAIGIFWLTRSLRGRDVALACQSAMLLATLVHPGAQAMRALVLRSWPEGGGVMLRLALSRRQPPALRAAALTFLAVSMSSSSVDNPDDATFVSEGIIDFGREALLARTFLWDHIASDLPAPGIAPRLATACTALLQQRAAASLEDLSDYITEQPHLLKAIVAHLDMRYQLAATATVHVRRCLGWYRSTVQLDGQQSHCGLRALSVEAVAAALRVCAEGSTSATRKTPSPVSAGALVAWKSESGGALDAAHADREALHALCNAAAGLGAPHTTSHAVSCDGQSIVKPSSVRSSGGSWASPTDAHCSVAASPAFEAAAGAACVLHASVKQQVLDSVPPPASDLESWLTLLLSLLASAASTAFVVPIARSDGLPSAAMRACLASCQCTSAVMATGAVSAPMLQRAVQEAEAYAHCVFGATMAVVLSPESGASHELLEAASHALASMLGSEPHAGALFSHAHGTREMSPLMPPRREHDMPSVPGVPAAEERAWEPVGDALVRALLCRLRASTNGRATGAGEQGLSAGRTAGPLQATALNGQDRHAGPLTRDGELQMFDSDSVTAAMLAALRGVLAYSVSAKHYVLKVEEHKVWLRQCAMSCDMLALNNCFEGQGIPRTGNDSPAASGKAARRDVCACLAMHLGLLRHLAHGSGIAKTVIAEGGACESLQQGWRAIVVSDGLCEESLQFLATLLVDSFEARHLFTTEGKPPLLVRVIRVALRSGTSRPVIRAAGQVLCNLAAALDGTIALLKSTFATSACKLLRRCVAHASEDPAAACLLRVLATMATHGEGQRQLLRLSEPPSLLDVVLEVAGAPRMRASAKFAVLLLRNLCFRADNKAFFLADPRALPLFVHQLENVSANPHNAACAASALWALVHRGERVKATLKGIPAAVSSIQRCLHVCTALMEDAQGAAGEDSCTNDRTAQLRHVVQCVRVVLRVLGVTAA